MAKEQELNQNTNTSLYERAWRDEVFMALLESDPKAALVDYVGAIPEAVEIKVVRDTDRVKYLHIPEAPVQDEITDLELLEAQGGTTPVCISMVSPVISVTGTITVGVSVAISIATEG
ncbi:hypothetical protein Q5Y75_06860 [Ruegeria sp. 2205SS24-7]|uniref:hypothetical protein n=1 Tax=Ruegeria discodermiae TaxID=3064389 RepID=UPI0027418A11|nr:hypothetical protein [Ruegeria sp. 2205SS24-7]MDP5216932.1 hypothetical protein [Ruegeria sp. 2205SS24-7]